MGRPDPTLADRVREALRGRRERVPSRELIDALGLDLDEEDFFWSVEDVDGEVAGDLKWWPEEAWSHVPTLLDGAIAAHRLTIGEVDNNWLVHGPDTASLLAAFPHPGVDGPPVELDLEGEARWRLPEGTLSTARPDDLFVLRHGTARVAFEVVAAEEADLAELTDDDAERLRSLVAGMRERGDVEAADLVLQLGIDWPEFLTEPCILGEVLDRAGLPVVGDFVLAPGEDPHRWQLDRRREAIDPHGEWPDEAVDGVAAVMDAVRTVEQGGHLDLPVARGVDAALADADTFELFCELELKGWLDQTGPLEAFLAELDDVLDRELGAGALTLRSRLAERAGDLDQHLATNGAARRAGFVPALLDHACNLEDAADIRAAVSVLRRVGVHPDDGQRKRLESLLEEAYPGTGRNEPCPCGSDRKYKKCHMEGGPTVEIRPHWVFDRMIEWLLRPAMRPLARELSQVYSDRFEQQVEALTLPTAAGIALFDAGAARHYLEGRRGLFEEVDVAMVERWIDETRMDALEAIELSDEGARVRSAVDGREFELVSEAAARVWPIWGQEIMVGAHVAARSDGVLVALSLCPAPAPLDDLPEVIAEGDPLGLAAWYEGHLMLSDLVDRRKAADADDW